MSKVRATGWMLFLLGLVAAGYGAARLALPEDVPSLGLSSDGATSLGVGVALVALGLYGATRPTRSAPAQDPAPPPTPVPEPEIKRTDMRWATREPSPAEGEVGDQLEEVRRKMGQLKVRYGLGEIGPQAYKSLMKELEDEETRLERDRLQQAGS